MAGYIGRVSLPARHSRRTGLNALPLNAAAFLKTLESNAAAWPGAWSIASRWCRRRGLTGDDLNGTAFR